MTARERAEGPDIYVSYAWGDDQTPEGRAREAAVDQACAEAERLGRRILRDRAVLRTGDSISGFMRRIGAGDRIFVFLSDKYLRSPFCMFELSEIWRTSGQEGRAFLDRIRLYPLPDAKYRDPRDWVAWSVYWKEMHDEYDNLIRAHGSMAGEAFYNRLKQTQRFYTQVSDILALLADSVSPRDFEDFVRHGFDEPDAAPPPPPPIIGPSLAAWKKIADSLDVHDYADFLDIYPAAPEALDARRHRRQLTAWQALDKTRSDAVTPFLETKPFPALEVAARAVADRLARAKEAAATAERERREAFERRLGPAAARAFEAAMAKEPVAKRSFQIEIPGVAGWPAPSMVAIPPGRFEMGSPPTEAGRDDDEGPIHSVAIDHVFAIGRGPVTVDAFAAFVAEAKPELGDGAFVRTGGEWKFAKGKDWRDPGFAQSGTHPVTCVSWDDAMAFVAWLNRKLGLTDPTHAYRLPSEAEWEYACRAGTTTPFSFGDTITTGQANFDGNYTYGSAQKSGVFLERTTPVGQYPANGFGPYDMHGNVWEWCEDVWHDTYADAPTDGTAWVTGGSSRRVVRGGSWFYIPDFLRSARRFRIAPTFRYDFLGFRLARTLSPPAS